MSRLLPGTLGDSGSLKDESHNNSLLEYPQFTRPQIFKEMKVPDVLLSGNHEKIKNWREEKMLQRTEQRRKGYFPKKDFDKLTKKNKIENNNQNFKELDIDFKSYIYPDW